MKDEETTEIPTAYRALVAIYWECIRGHWARYLPGYAIGTMGAAALQLAEPYVFGKITDAIVTQMKTGQLAFDARIISLLAAFAGVSLASRTASALLITFVLNRFSNRTFLAVGRKLFLRVLHLDVKRFKHTRGGELFRWFDHLIDAVFQFSFTVLRQGIPASLEFVGAILIGCVIEWRLTLLSLAVVPVIVYGTRMHIRVAGPSQRAADAMWDVWFGFVGDCFTNIMSVKALARESTQAAAYNAGLQNGVTASEKADVKRILPEIILASAAMIGQVLVLGAGIWFVTAGGMSIGELFLCFGLQGRIVSATYTLVDIVPNFLKMASKATPGVALWNEVPEIQDAPNAVVPKRLRGDIRFNHVSFDYANGKRVLHDVSFRLEPGTTTALVGETGAGKSTIAGLLPRFYDATQGVIMVDGVHITRLALEPLRRNIGIVSQESILFHASVLENIRLAKPEATDEEVVAAAVQAQAHTFISALRDGYNTIVGERGTNLSGGERQRIAIARVILADTPVLILDEATSALDSKTEAAIQKALKIAMNGRTCLVIAHRLSTVMDADQILVIDGGRVTDRGTHEDLLRRQGSYREFWQIQAGRYDVG